MTRLLGLSILFFSNYTFCQINHNFFEELKGDILNTLSIEITLKKGDTSNNLQIKDSTTFGESNMKLMTYRDSQNDSIPKNIIYGYDSLSRLTKVSYYTNKNLQLSYRFDYNKSSQASSQTLTFRSSNKPIINPIREVVYQYDSLNRVSSKAYYFDLGHRLRKEPTFIRYYSYSNNHSVLETTNYLKDNKTEIYKYSYILDKYQNWVTRKVVDVTQREKPILISRSNRKIIYKQ